VLEFRNEFAQTSDERNRFIHILRTRCSGAAVLDPFITASCTRGLDLAAGQNSLFPARPPHRVHYDQPFIFGELRIDLELSLTGRTFQFPRNAVRGALENTAAPPKTTGPQTIINGESEVDVTDWIRGTTCRYLKLA
jgi:hypothetical protein